MSVEPSDLLEVDYGHVRCRVLKAEADVRASHEDELGSQLRLVDDASSLLLGTLEEVGRRYHRMNIDLSLDKAGAPRGNPAAFILLAQYYIGVRAYRVIRVARRALCSGYEGEAMPYDRILVELVVHRKVVRQDLSGKGAVDWLQAKLGKGIGRQVAEIARGDLYGFLSARAHADPRALTHLMNPDEGAILIHPQQTGAALPSAWLYASFAYDQAELVAGIAGFKLTGVGDLKEAIVGLRTTAP